MDYLKAHVRTCVYMTSILIALAIYVFIGNSEIGTLRTIRFEEGFGFTASIYLLLALLPTPLYSVFSTTPGKAVYTHARRAIGISTFCFAFLHAYISFFGLLAGFAGIPFLDTRYEFLLGSGTIALIILFLMASTSFDIAVRLLGPWWKRLHRFVYVAGILALVHVTLLGSHFSNPTSILPMVFITTAFAFLALEAARLDKKYVAARGERLARFSGRFVLCCILLTVLFMILTSGEGFLHAGHNTHSSASSTPITL